MMSKATRIPPMLRFVLICFSLIWLVIVTFPFLWTFWGSFKVEGDFFSKVDWTRVLTGPMTIRETGDTFTGQGYYGAWIEEEFWRSTLNTVIVVVSVVSVSLTIATLGGYALARSKHNYAFWILMLALVFGLLVASLSMESLGPSSNSHHCPCCEQSTLHALDDDGLFPQHSHGAG
jgi:trehalose/maltose transport system permease protein